MTLSLPVDLTVDGPSQTELLWAVTSRTDVVGFSLRLESTKTPQTSGNTSWSRFPNRTAEGRGRNLIKYLSLVALNAQWRSLDGWATRFFHQT